MEAEIDSIGLQSLIFARSEKRMESSKQHSPPLSPSSHDDGAAALKDLLLYEKKALNKRLKREQRKRLLLEELLALYSPDLRTSMMDEAISSCSLRRTRLSSSSTSSSSSSTIDSITSLLQAARLQLSLKANHQGDRLHYADSPISRRDAETSTKPVDGRSNFSSTARVTEGINNNFYRSTRIVSSENDAFFEDPLVDLNSPKNANAWHWIDLHGKSYERMPRTLSEYLQRNRPALLSRSVERQHRLRQFVTERMERETNRRLVAQAVLNGSLTLEHAQRSAPLQRSCSLEINAQSHRRFADETKRRVYHLPEFVQRRYEQKKQQELATNRLLSQIYNQKVAARALRMRHKS